MFGTSLKSDCQGSLCWLFIYSRSEDCAKHVRVYAGLPVTDSDRRFGRSSGISRYAKDLQDGPQIMALGNGPKRD